MSDTKYHRRIDTRMVDAAWQRDVSRQIELSLDVPTDGGADELTFRRTAEPAAVDAEHKWADLSLETAPN